MQVDCIPYIQLSVTQTKGAHRMYQKVLGVTPAVAGIATLPNTGSSPVLTALSLISIAAGAVVLLTTVARYVAKKRYNA